MIDSSVLLLTIVMTTPAEYLSDNDKNYASFNSLGDIMQRLCWPHTDTLNKECEAKNVRATNSYREPTDQSLTKALNTMKIPDGKGYFSTQ